MCNCRIEAYRARALSNLTIQFSGGEAVRWNAGLGTGASPGRNVKGGTVTKRFDIADQGLAIANNHSIMSGT
jgi:hypothetical protein